ncbi:hypothetical protein CAPTEDRAFT_224281 [Capitella teleta]|uniref:Uncharacterized protein n=1 Tax=Capitella teleta TaxID=283909 RepID=R7TVK4_CAPTE|nr:hypothetical protein CAPTEDRAFT_224281 [Capitella teleta]|eukprot:ELT97617.1 hypothetical protein CAPTEDRAFT_224281 [Capitella teleta]
MPVLFSRISLQSQSTESQTMDMDLFRERSHALLKLKKRSNILMADFNRLYSDYSDWFKRQERSFIGAIKSVQLVIPTLVPRDIRTVTEFRHLSSMAMRIDCLAASGAQAQFKIFENFWIKFMELKNELENEFLPELDVLIAKVDTFRANGAQAKIEKLRRELFENCGIDYDFSRVHDERNHLFTYRLMVSDQGFLGLVGYLPFLLNFAIKICFLVNKLFIEVP